MKKQTLLADTDKFQLVKHQRIGKNCYMIKVMLHWQPQSYEDEVFAYFGPPLKDTVSSWRFWNRLEAEKQFMYATLRWN